MFAKSFVDGTIYSMGIMTLYATESGLQSVLILSSSSFFFLFFSSPGRNWVRTPNPHHIFLPHPQEGILLNTAKIGVTTR